MGTGIQGFCALGARARVKDMLVTDTPATAVDATLRALLAARWVALGFGIPPVPFADLLPSAPPGVMAETFGLAGRWVEGPDGPLLSSGRYSDGSPSGDRSASSPA